MFCKDSCVIKLWSSAVVIWRWWVRKWGLDGGCSVLGMCFEGNSGFLEPSSPFASWSPWGEQLCSTMVFCLSIVQKQWRQIAMNQNHNPRHIFPPLSSFLGLFGHSHGTPGPQVALVLCPIAFVSSISVEQAQGTQGDLRPHFSLQDRAPFFRSSPPWLGPPRDSLLSRVAAERVRRIRDGKS